MPTSRRQAPAYPPVYIANMTNDYLFLGFGSYGKNGMWLAPKGQSGYYAVFKGLDLNDQRVITSLKNLGNSLKIYLAVEGNATLPAALGINTTAWPTTPSP